MSSQKDLTRLVIQRVTEAGGIVTLAAKSGVNASTISKISLGRWSVSETTLLKLGIQRIVTYELCDPKQPDFE